jgi:predicted nuclease of predicted toxin-antitoxin system
MRILLDESLPRNLGHALPGHKVRTVPQMGWAGLKNGELLRRATGQFDVLVTGDQNLEYQQNLARLLIPVVVLIAVNNRIETLHPLVPKLLQVLSPIAPGELVRVST